jgi:magnesium transporter
MSRHRHPKYSLKRRGSVGAVPGTIVADPAAPQPEISAIAFGPQQFIERDVKDVRELTEIIGKHPVTWINVDGLGSAETIQQLGKQFGLHALALEDTVNTHQRAKADEFRDVLFVVMRMVSGPPLVTEQISFFVGRNFVLTFQEGMKGDCLNAVRERIRNHRGRICDAGPDYLFYELLDSVIDGYFPVLERYGELLDDLDSQVATSRLAQTLTELHLIRRDLLFLRRIVWPIRDVMMSLLRGGHPQISPDTQIYLRDCYDHAAHLIDILEIYRETCSDLRDFFYSKLSNRTNEIMRTLTVIATVFMPLSFIAGVYGMNFDWMPELKWPWGYPMCLGMMGATALGFLFFCWRKGWLKSAEPRAFRDPMPMTAASELTDRRKSPGGASS